MVLCFIEKKTEILPSYGQLVLCTPMPFYMLNSTVLL